MKTRKILKLITAFVFAALLITAIPAGAWTTEAYTEKELGVTVTLGYMDDLWFTDMQNRVCVELTNNTGADLEGTIELTVSTYNNAQGTVILPYSLAAGVSKKTDTRIIGTKNDNYMECKVYNKNGKLLRSVTMSLNIYSGMSASDICYIGWISDKASDASALYNRNGTVVLTDNGDQMYLICEPLTPSGFPEDLDSICNFSAIIVNDVDLSDSSAFSTKQVELLKQYIALGGTVIVGTGSNTEILKAFSDYFAKNPSKAASVSQLNNVEDKRTAYIDQNSYYGYGKNSGSINLYRYNSSYYSSSYDLVSLTFDKIGICTIEDDNFSASPKKENAVFALYKNKDCNLFIMNANPASDKLLKYSDSAAFILSVLYDSFVPFYEANESNYADLNILETLYDTNPSFVILFFILILYLGLGIVLPFVIAKKKNKASLAWIGIPASALIFSMLFFGYSFILKSSNSKSFSVEISDVMDNGYVRSSFSGLTTATTGGSKTVSFDKEGLSYFGMLSYDDSLNSYYYTYNNTLYTIDYSGDGGVTNTSVTTGTTVSAKASSVYSTGEGFEISVSDGSRYTLSVTNKSGKNYSDAFIYYGGNTMVIGNFKAGETKTFSNLTTTGNKFSAETAIINLFYNPNNIPTYSFSQGISNYGIPYATSSIDYYYNYRTNILKDILSDLEEVSHEDFIKASLIFQLTAKNTYNNNYTVTDESFIMAFEDGTSPNLLVNGKKASNSTNIRIVRQTFPLIEAEVDYSDLKEIQGTLEIYPAANGAYITGYEIELFKKTADVLAYVNIPMEYFYAGDFAIKVEAKSKGTFKTEPSYFVCDTAGYSEPIAQKIENNGTDFTLNLSEVYYKYILFSQYYNNIVNSNYGSSVKWYYYDNILYPNVQFPSGNYISVDTTYAPTIQDGYVTVFFPITIYQDSSSNTVIDELSYSIFRTN